MINFYIFNINSVNVAVFGKKDIDAYRSLFRINSNNFEEGGVKKNTVFFSLMKTVKDIWVILKTVNNLKELVKILIYSYKVERCNCPVIITSLFYSQSFHYLSIVKNKNKRFIAVSVAYGHYENEERIFGRKWKNFKFQNIELLLQGDWQKDFIKKKCNNTGKITVVGGLNNALYISKKHDIEKQYDICIISNFKESYGNSLANASFYSVLRKVCSEIGFTICVAGRYSGQDLIDSEEECRYFKDNLGGSIFFLPRHGHSTYELSDRSYISIGDHTTSLIESFGRGCKIMACNPSLLPQLDFPITGVWTLSEYEYDSVKRKILKILSIKKSEWLKVTCSSRENLLHNGESALPINNIGNILFGNR